jgi:hypothetical protein
VLKAAVVDEAAWELNMRLHYMAADFEGSSKWVYGGIEIVTLAALR